MTDTVVIPPELVLPHIIHRVKLLAFRAAVRRDTELVAALDGLTEDLVSLAAQLPAVS